ncbi:MAG: AraC family transcriptional regulator [Clostridia bacterium]|nr:AraC family transcriptional regulator [Clostridia bacterium]
MGTEFNYFLSIIPPDIYSGTKATVCRYMAIFEAEEYVLGKVLRADDYHFLLFLSKAPITKVNDVEYHVKKGDMLVIQPWEGIYGVPGENKEYGKYLHIAVKKEFFQEIAAEIAKEGTFAFKRIQGRYSNHLLDLIGEFQLEIMNYGQAYPQMIRSLSTQIVFQLIRDLHAEEKPGREKVGRDNQYINKAILFMQENYQENITIRDICDLIYFSPYHFKRIFKEHTGRTPHRYLMDIRLEKAKELLARSENSIENIARLCGFVNPGHFAVAFKRSIKMTPSEYRKMHG